MDKIFPIIVLVVVTALVAYRQRWVSSNYDYQYTNCGETFSLPLWQAVFAPHAMGRKLVRCPHCGQIAWATPVPKENGS